MKRPRIAVDTRKDLDQRFEKWKPAIKDQPPRGGWIKEIREALGMTAKQLAAMLDIKQQSIASIERSEAKGIINLKTLRRVAKQMNCHLVYAVVPKLPLKKMLRNRAFGILMPQVLVSLHRNKCKVSNAVIEQMVNKLIDERGMLDQPRLLWNEITLPEEMERAIHGVKPPPPSVPLPLLPEKADIDEVLSHVQALIALRELGKVEE